MENVDVWDSTKLAWYLTHTEGVKGFDECYRVNDVKIGGIPFLVYHLQPFLSREYQNLTPFQLHFYQKLTGETTAFLVAEEEGGYRLEEKDLQLTEESMEEFREEERKVLQNLQVLDKFLQRWEGNDVCRLDRGKVKCLLSHHLSTELKEYLQNEKSLQDPMQMDSFLTFL